MRRDYKGIQKYIEEQLKEGNPNAINDVVVRVKFLRPYQLRNSATNSNKAEVKNFRAGIEDLYNNNIPTRIQPLGSAKKLADVEKFQEVFTGQRKVANAKKEGEEGVMSKDPFKTDVIKTLFAKDEDMQQLNKTWSQLCVGRKGESKGERV